MRLPASGTIVSYTPADAVGRIELEDGTEVRFGHSALGRPPLEGIRVVIDAIAPHPLGGWRATQLRIDPTAQADYEAALKRLERERSARVPAPAQAHAVAPEPLSAEEGAALESHRRQQRQAAAAMEGARHRAREDAWRAMTSSQLDELGVRRQVATLLTEAELPVSRIVPRTSIASRFCALWESGRGDGLSRLGGMPEVAAGFDWPRHSGRPLAFLLQLDLSELRAHVGASLLPDAGRLLFFFDAAKQPWGFDPADSGSGAVIYEQSTASLVPAIAPDDLAAECRFPSVATRFYRAPSLPGPFSDWARALDLEDDAYDRYWMLDAQLDRLDTRHQILGEADPIQNPMELECQLASNGVYCGDEKGHQDPRVRELAAGARDWRLLLQLDSDDRADMCWGDAGRLYFWIREADLRARQFGRVWVVLQCT